MVILSLYFVYGGCHSEKSVNFRENAKFLFLIFDMFKGPRLPRITELGDVLLTEGRAVGSVPAHIE